VNRSPSPIEAARQRHSLAEVVARTEIWLPTTSGKVTVRCPMPSHGHPDRTPSLRLYLDDGTWYCFACSEHAGDVVQWVQQTESVDWRHAIEILDSGRQLTNAWAGAVSDSGHCRVAAMPATVEMADLTRTPSARIQQVLDAAWDHCTIGPLHARAVVYLSGRHIDATVLESYTRRPEAGHTPTHGPTLAKRLLSDGFSHTEIVDAGIAYRTPDGKVVDLYRQRVLIPIRDNQGRVVGLVGRNVGDPRWPKYKNPPRTALYDKSVNLYQPLPPPRHPNGRVVVVEGTLDAMAIAVTAVRTGTTHYFCPVTQSGRVISPFQADSVLQLHAGQVVVSFDGDAAGRESNLKLAAAFQNRGRPVSIAWLPEDLAFASALARLGPPPLGFWDGRCPGRFDPSRGHTSVASCQVSVSPSF
jgi:DNA primase